MGEVDEGISLGVALVVSGVSLDGDELKFSSTDKFSFGGIEKFDFSISSEVDEGKVDTDASLGVALVSSGLS